MKPVYHNQLPAMRGYLPLTIFPATIDEVKEFFSASIESIKEDIEKDKKKLQEKIEAIEKAEQFVTGELSKTLSEPEFIEMTQQEFNTKKQELLGE